MPAFTTSALAADIHDGEFTRPPKIGAFQYQIPPSKVYANVDNMAADIGGELQPQCLSLVFSNLSLEKYTIAGKLENDINALRCGLERLDLDFTQLTRKSKKLVDRASRAVNHVQHICDYGLFVSVTVPVGADLRIPQLHIQVINTLLEQFVNVQMINVLITKGLKQRNVTWPSLIRQAFSNASIQLQSIFTTGPFPGKIAKYFGLVLDCDVALNAVSPLKSTVRQILVHGDRKNIHEHELLEIWRWICANGGGQLMLKVYPSNSKNVHEFITNNAVELSASQPLPLPADMLNVLIAEEQELPHYDNLGLERTPTYRTVGS